MGAELKRKKAKGKGEELKANVEVAAPLAIKTPNIEYQGKQNEDGR